MTVIYFDMEDHVTVKDVELIYLKGETTVLVKDQGKTKIYMCPEQLEHVMP